MSKRSNAFRKFAPICRKNKRFYTIKGADAGWRPLLFSGYCKAEYTFHQASTLSRIRPDAEFCLSINNSVREA